MKSARIALVCLAISVAGCHFAVEGVGPGGGDPTMDPGGGGMPAQPGDPPDLGTDQPDLTGIGSAPTQGNGGGLGDPCDSQTLCMAGLTCLTKAGGDKGLTFPNGYCTKICMLGVTCPAGSTCVDVDHQSVCLLDCSGPAATCAGGNQCCNYKMKNECVPTKACGPSGPGPGPGGET